MNATSTAAVLLPQWLSTAGAFWLVWWAAQSRDGVAFRALALTFAIVPAVLMPLLTIAVRSGEMSAANMSAMFTVVAIGVSALRGLFLLVWAIASRDAPALRIGGGVIALLLLIWFLLAAMAMAMLGSSF